MNFQDLLKVEKADTYIDFAFKQAQNAADKTREKSFPHRFAKSKAVESDKVAGAAKTLLKHMQNILHSFPSIDQLDPFYVDLIKLSVDYAKLKKSLGAVNWAKKTIEKFAGQYRGKISRCEDMEKINGYRKEFFGRMSSCMKQISKELWILEESRKIMKSFPNIKTSLFTVCICGFPNVGKSTLLSKLTTATPDIQDYAFTTRRLNLGYIKEQQQKVQLIDTPGTLDRFEKMNDIEKQAVLAIKHCANALIYVFDLTEPFPLDDQKKLFDNIKKENEKKLIIIYLSKTDILDKKIVDEFKIQGIKTMLLSPAEVKKALLSSAKSHKI